MAEPSRKTSSDYTLTAPGGKAISLAVREPTLGPATLDINPLYREEGIFTFDPGFVSTASCESSITYIDGENGVLLFRGYPIEVLAENCSFLEVAWLLQYGELPRHKELSGFETDIRKHAALDESVGKLVATFDKKAHPMAMLTAAVASLAGIYHEETDIRDADSRDLFARRIAAKMPAIAAAVYRQMDGRPVVAPRDDLGYAENLLHLFFAENKDYKPNPVAARAIDLLFVLHADHEQNASTSTVRLAGSSGTDPYAAIAAGAACLWGPAHGGANAAVVEMLGKIGSPDNIDKYVARAKDKDDPFRLMGFGHRVYKNYDPRAKIIRKMTHEVLESLGGADEPLLDLALALEKVALEDDYFVSHKLYPNVDFYSGIIYKALGLPTEMFTVMFAIARSVGWVANWCEMMSDPKMRIGRPRQLYTGAAKREFVPIAKRD
ncbi:MAG: citrate synthase [Gammaproteobacteria bacterium]